MCMKWCEKCMKYLCIKNMSKFERLKSVSKNYQQQKIILELYEMCMKWFEKWKY